MTPNTPVRVRPLPSVPPTYRTLCGTLVEPGTSYVTRLPEEGWWVKLEDGRVVWLREAELEVVE